MKNAIAWFADNHVAANLLMIFFLLAGGLAGSSMKVEVFPETDLDIITITTVYSGASPAEVEEARRAGAIAVSLGPTRLRSETAAIVAVALAMAALPATSPREGE